MRSIQQWIVCWLKRDFSLSNSCSKLDFSIQEIHEHTENVAPITKAKQINCDKVTARDRSSFETPTVSTLAKRAIAKAHAHNSVGMFFGEETRSTEIERLVETHREKESVDSISR